MVGVPLIKTFLFSTPPLVWENLTKPSHLRVWIFLFQQNHIPSQENLNVNMVGTPLTTFLFSTPSLVSENIETESFESLNGQSAKHSSFLWVWQPCMQCNALIAQLNSISSDKSTYFYQVSQQCSSIHVLSVTDIYMTQRSNARDH